MVGYCDGWRDIIIGYGRTWEEAFRLADQTPIDTSEEGGPDPNGIPAAARRLMQRRRGLYSQFDPAGCVEGKAAMLGSGLGLITTSNFFVPQVNLPGSMAAFVPPAAVVSPVAVPMTTGLGQSLTDSSPIFDMPSLFLAAYWPYIVGGVLLLIALGGRRR